MSDSDQGEIERAAQDRLMLLLRAHVDDSVKKPLENIDKKLKSIHAKLRRLSVAVIMLTLMVAVMGFAVFGYLVNYMDGEAMFYGGSAMGAALLGFLAGWVARRRG